MWKYLTGMISEAIYCFMVNENLLPEEQKGCRMKIREIKNQLLIDKKILKDYRKRRTHIAMAWIDYRKVCYFDPHIPQFTSAQPEVRTLDSGFHAIIRLVKKLHQLL